MYKIRNKCFILLAFLLGSGIANAQQTDTAKWTLQQCIEYAGKENIQVRKSMLTNEVNANNYKQSLASRYPSLQASVSQNFNWSKEQANFTYGDFNRTDATSYSVSSTTTLFNGFKISNAIKQSSINVEAGKYDTENTKESVSLLVLDAYLQVLFAEELVKNSQKQVESTAEQLRLATERFRLGSIAKSDFLQVKSALASEKLTLANAESQFAIARTNLMQLLELPLSNNFAIVYPEFGENVNQNRAVNPDSVYKVALDIKPEIKSATLRKESAGMDLIMARADYLPRLSLNLGVTSGYNSGLTDAYFTQVNNKVSPSVGFTLAIPIFQNYQVKTKVANAKIGISNAELDEINIRNQLRKSIEQACVDVLSAEKEFDAGLEQYSAAKESYQVASEKFTLGLINSVDFLIQKNNFISAESKYLQSKYKLIFSYKTLDFYTGTPLTL